MRGVIDVAQVDLRLDCIGEGGAGRFLVEPARAITGSRDPDQ